MVSLNDPVGFEEREEVEWTPAQGLRTGLKHGLFYSVVVVLLLWPLSAQLPYLMIPWHTRSALAFGMAYGMFVVVQRGAGMAGRNVTALVIGLTLLVLLTQHAVFAWRGVPDPTDHMGWFVFPARIVQGIVGLHGGLMIGWGWFHPYVLIAVNGFPAVGIVFAALFRHKG